MDTVKVQAGADETTALFRDLNKPSLHGLSYALRHPDTWPNGFVWDYGYCSGCAMGLAHALWGFMSAQGVGGNEHGGIAVTEAARAFAVPYKEAKNIFLGIEDGYTAPWIPTKTKTKGALFWKKEVTKANHTAVTPEMVADQIDAYLAKAE